ncbi:MAG: hypothetical protein RLZZ585_363 [Bacteroidota bacterium]|jgi:hypothetical protein
MKLAGIKFILLLTIILLSGTSYADLRMPELAMELILKKNIHQNREIIQFEVKFTNQTDRSLSILLPGTQNKGKRLLQLQVFSVNNVSNFYTKVFENPMILEMDTSFIGSVYFKRLEARESVSIPLFVNDTANAQKNILSNYSFPDLANGSYQVIAYYNPFGEALAPYAFQAYDDHGRSIEDSLNPERMQIDAWGVYSNYVELSINSVLTEEIEAPVCSGHCRFCRHIQKEQWNRVKKDIIHRVDNIAAHEHVRFLFHGPDAVLSSLPAYYSRQIVFDTQNGLKYKYLTWQIGKIYRFRSFIHSCCYWVFRWNAPVRTSSTKYFHLISVN